MVKIGKGNFSDKFPENNRFERIWVIAKTDFIQRYYGSFFGIFWAFLNPLFQLLIFYFIFTWFFDNRIENYALYVLSGLLMWMFFAESSRKGLSLLKSKRYLYENIQINKLDIFHSSIAATLFALLINFIIYIAASLFFHVEYSWAIIMFPFLIIMACAFVFSLSLILALLNVFFEDIDHVWDIALLAIFWTIPLFYPQELLIEKYNFILYINPLSGIVINIREVLMYGQWPSLNILLYNIIFIIILTFVSLLLFKKFHHKSAEKL